MRRVQGSAMAYHQCQTSYKIPQIRLEVRHTHTHVKWVSKTQAAWNKPTYYAFCSISRSTHANRKSPSVALPPLPSPGRLYPSSARMPRANSRRWPTCSTPKAWQLGFAWGGRSFFYYPDPMLGVPVGPPLARKGYPQKSTHPNLSTKQNQTALATFLQLICFV